jgi:hypothetical protein
LEKNLDKVDWGMLSTNPNAVYILEQNLDRINWNLLSANPNAIHILERNMDKINWHWLTENPNAIHILERNMDKIDYSSIYFNPNAEPLLFNLDYEKMRNIFVPFAKEIVEYVFHPSRISRMANQFGIEVVDYLDLM